MKSAKLLRKDFVLGVFLCIFRFTKEKFTSVFLWILQKNFYINYFSEHLCNTCLVTIRCKTVNGRQFLTAQQLDNIGSQKTLADQQFKTFTLTSHYSECFLLNFAKQTENETLCAMWYHLWNSHKLMLPLVNFTKNNTLPRVFFTFLKL